MGFNRKLSSRLHETWHHKQATIGGHDDGARFMAKHTHINTYFLSPSGLPDLAEMRDDNAPNMGVWRDIRAGVHITHDDLSALRVPGHPYSLSPTCQMLLNFT